MCRNGPDPVKNDNDSPNQRRQRIELRDSNGASCWALLLIRVNTGAKKVHKTGHVELLLKVRNSQFIFILAKKFEMTF